MAALIPSSSTTIIILFFFLLSLIQISPSFQTCQDKCGIGGPDIRFPFGLLNDTYYTTRCNYPGFSLSCNTFNQTVLTLPQTPGDFIVQSINYTDQIVSIRDPDDCLPKRFLHGSFSLLGSPFVPESFLTFGFLACNSSGPPSVSWIRPVPCLNSNNYTVWAILDGSMDRNYLRLLDMCTVIRRQVWIPVAWLEDSWTRLVWNEPSCGSCEIKGGNCGFNTDSSDLQYGCSRLPKSGLPRSAKYGIIIGIGIPGLMFFIGTACYLCSRLRDFSNRHRQSFEASTEISTTIVPQRSYAVTGLDGPTIESYPKTQLGESRRLPKPNDTTCPICLSEYQPKETLRTIPECNHYFHVDCIDEWLKVNGTCPLCRNSPDTSALTTPISLSVSSSSSLSTV